MQHALYPRCVSNAALSFEIGLLLLLLCRASRRVATARRSYNLPGDLLPPQISGIQLGGRASGQ
eukprot:12507109-Alexandrium_andersonii.AAC.1